MQELHFAKAEGREENSRQDSLIRSVQPVEMKIASCPIAAFVSACGDLSAEQLARPVVAAATRDLVDVANQLRAAGCLHDGEKRPDGIHVALAEEISDAARTVLLAIGAQMMTMEGDCEKALPGESAVALGLQLCTAIFDASSCRSFGDCNAADVVDAALGFLRVHQASLAWPTLQAIAEQVLKSLGNIVQSRTLDSERLRRSLAIAADAVATNLGRADRVAVFAAAGDTLVIAISATSGARAESFELMLESLSKHMSSVASSGRSKITQALTSIFLRSLAATCAPPLISGPLEEWMPKCHAESRHCGRLLAVMLVQCASRGNTETRCFIEQLAGEIADATTNPEWPAAPLALKSLVGSLTIILRSRGSGDMKVFAVRILGRIAAGLGNAEGAKTHFRCSFCQGVKEQASSAEKQIPCVIEQDRSSASCDECLQRMAMEDLVGKANLPSLPLDSIWVARHLVLCATGNDITQDVPTGKVSKCEMPTSSKQFAAASPDLDFVCTCSFFLCEWAAGVWPSYEAEDGREISCGRFLISQAWSRLAACRSQERWTAEPRLGPEHATRMLRPYAVAIAKEALTMQHKTVRAMLLQLRSPRAWLRSTALRALGSVAEAVSTHNIALKTVPRQVLLSTLSKDPSANARRAALAIIGRSLLRENIAKEDAVARKWAWGAVRLASSDSSTFVRNAACRLLGEFIQKYPDDPSAIDACGDLVTWLVSQRSEDDANSSEACPHATTFEYLRAFIFTGSGLRESALMQIMETVHRIGAQGFLPGLLRAHRSATSLDKHNKIVECLAAVFVRGASSKSPHAAMAGLVQLAEAAPWALVEHAPIISVFLAVGEPPSAKEEALALGACTILAKVLVSFGIGATRLLWQSAWARIDKFVLSHGSRLARPAMRCLCAAANAEGSITPILGHLRAAVRVIRSEVAEPRGCDALMRAAWTAATACEECDLDKMCSLMELGLRFAPQPNETPVKGRGSLKASSPPGVGSVIAADLLRLYGVLAVRRVRDSVLPALILALGFALRRHSKLAASPSAVAAFAHGLAAAPGGELLAEQSLEALSQLLEHYIGRATKEASDSVRNDGPGADEVLSRLAQQQHAVLRLLCRGLFRQREAADVSLRSRALSAARALHKAGLGHPSSLAQSLFAPLFADRALRRSASALLCTIAERDSAAVAAVVATGVRDAFAAMLWQVPQQLAIAAESPGLHRAAFGVQRAFQASVRRERERWLRALLAELHNLEATSLQNRLRPLPAESLRISRGTRLAPFGGDSRRNGKATPKAVASSFEAQWMPAERLSVLYGHFVTLLITSLSLNEAEMELLSQECTRYLELRAAAASSACEHGGDSGGLFAVCVASTASQVLAQSIKMEAGQVRVTRARELLAEELRKLAVAARIGPDALAAWLSRTVEGACESPQKRGRGRPRKDTCGQEKSQFLTPPKRRLPLQKFEEPVQKRRRETLEATCADNSV